MKKHDAKYYFGMAVGCLIVIFWLLALIVVPAAITKFCWLYLMGV